MARNRSGNKSGDNEAPKTRAIILRFDMAKEEDHRTLFERLERAAEEVGEPVAELALNCAAIGFKEGVKRSKELYEKVRAFRQEAWSQDGGSVRGTGAPAPAKPDAS